MGLVTYVTDNSSDESISLPEPTPTTEAEPEVKQWKRVWQADRAYHRAYYHRRREIILQQRKEQYAERKRRRLNNTGE